MTAVGRLRTHRRSTVLVGGVLGVLVALTVLAVRSAGRGGDLDPDNPQAPGAQAVARVLEDHGVAVRIVRRAAELRDAPVDRDSTAMVTSSEQLGRGTARQLDRWSRSAGALVVPAPAPVLLRALSLPVEARRARVPERTEAACADPLLDGLELEVGPSAGYRPAGGAGPGVVTCFPTDGGDAAPALLVRVERPVPTYAVAATDLFTNEHVDDADNAAVALRLLGQHDRLVWYVPDRRDVRAGDAGSLRAQLPRGLVPALWLVAAAVLCTMLWRGRRLGPLVVEPLPVVVKAVESTQGRGRLYRRVRDREHAAGILREATRRRLGNHLRLPPDTGSEELVHAVTRATGRPPDALRGLLETGSVPDDTALTRLAHELAALEREVHRP